MTYVAATFRYNVKNKTDCLIVIVLTTAKVSICVRGIKDEKGTGHDNFYAEFMK